MFGSNKGNSGASSSTTIVTECMHIEGNVKGCGAIHIDGTINGDVLVDETDVIGVNGKVFGSVRAKHALISGTIEGELTCAKVEVTKTGVISNEITAKDITCDGSLEATIQAENSIHITENGKVTTGKMKSKHIIVSGFVSGNLVATELLEIHKKGQTKGEMIVKKIKVSEGGLVLGTMLTYEESNSVRTVKVDTEIYDEDDAVEKEVVKKDGEA
jgi:cytoskeletal protein CcmA (bactofilin family)